MFRLDEMWDLFNADRVNYMIILFLVMFVLGIIASVGMLLCFVEANFCLLISHASFFPRVGRQVQFGSADNDCAMGRLAAG